MLSDITYGALFATTFHRSFHIFCLWMEIIFFKIDVFDQKGTAFVYLLMNVKSDKKLFQKI